MAVIILSNSTLITATSFVAKTFSGLSAAGAERAMMSSNEDMTEGWMRLVELKGSGRRKYEGPAA